MLGYAAEKAKLALAELEGELLRYTDVVQTWTAQIVACKRRLRGIPKVMVSRGELPKLYAQPVLRRIDEALNDLAGDGVPRERPAGRSRRR